jgi:subtilase family serine protease
VFRAAADKVRGSPLPSRFHFDLVCNHPPAINPQKEKFMTLKNPLQRIFIALLSVLLALGCVSAQAQQAKSNVPAGIRISKDLGRVDGSTEINITVHLKLNDKAGFDKAVDALYDAASPTYHKWMSNADIAKYAPADSQREAVRHELENHGLTILSTDSFGFTIRAHGTIANVESAFNTEIHKFEYKGRTFRANIRDARLSGVAGDNVSSVAGIESHQVRPLYKRAFDLRTHQPLPGIPLKENANTFPPGSTTDCLAAPTTYTLQGSSPLPTGVYTGTVYATDTSTSLVCDYLPSQLWVALGLKQIFDAGYTGKGQTIVLVEGYGYPTLLSDANAFYKMANLPQLNSSNFNIVYPEGKPNPELGILSGWNVEIALDMDSSHTTAPEANMVVVATYGQDNEDFQTSIMYVAENSLGNQVSNSYEEDLDLLAGPDEQTSWDDTIELATAKGISVNFSSGDGGDNGVGSPVGAPGVPSVAPHATSVGGTSILNDLQHANSTITTSWGDTWVYLESGGVVSDPPSAYGLYGGGGGGESVFWPKPSWQSSLPGTGRETPDVSALADPFTGFPIVLTNGTTQEVEYGWGGTSLACPIFSGFWALANQANGTALGQAAPLIAAMPSGGVQDVLPTTDSTPSNVTGSITDSSGTTDYSASQIFGSLLEGNVGFTSTIWPIDSGDYYDFGFGIDSSLTAGKGWDNATGWGTPHGLAFIEAATGKKK